MNNDIYAVIEHYRGTVAEISYVMLAAGRAMAEETGGDVIAVLLGHDAERLAATLAADRVLYLDHPTLAEFTSDAYIKALAGLLQERMPRALLFGSTSIGSDVAGAISVRLGMPLVSSCLCVGACGKFTCQICGGKVLAEIEMPASTVVITMVPGGYRPEAGMSQSPPEVIPVSVAPLEDLRVALLHYIEPEAADVDITRERVLISVGRGIQNQGNLELAVELADALGGVVCASRPVVDQGWLPITRLVGKSGKTVKPKIYLALGISGAPEHVESINGSELIIAINTDPSAPIFDIARYGVEIDMFDLIEVLTEKVLEAKMA